MANSYRQSVNSSKTRFTAAPMGELEFSRMHANPVHLTDFSAGDIVPIYCAEVLPHDTFEVSMDFVIRQATVATPTMGVLNADFYAFFVPNRVVNKSWKNVMGQNDSGAWFQDNAITLAPLVYPNKTASDRYSVPVCSVADYYGFPTQASLSGAVLAQCHDLKFRGYVEIYNTYFRDQNYQPPIPYSKLNVCNGFFETLGNSVGLDGGNANSVSVTANQASDGSFPRGAIQNAIYGDGSKSHTNYVLPPRKTSFCALNRPLKANKLHDYFTSVLPSPQKSREVVIPLMGDVTINTSNEMHIFSGGLTPLRFQTGVNVSSGQNALLAVNDQQRVVAGTSSATIDVTGAGSVVGSNLVGDLSGVELSINDIRMSSAMQQVYEILGRGGSRYQEYINSFFGLDIDNPFDDIPTYLGHFRQELDLFQTAQTSASPTSENPGTAQGNLAAFGYTNKGGYLFNHTFKEHGYVHIFAVIRHHNIYSQSLARDNFRLSMMDFYQYPLANISEQPVYSREINPLSYNDDSVFGYQEAWAEYRYEPDRVSGHMRPGAQLSLANWSYADDYSQYLTTADGDWLKSNTEEVVRRSTAVQDEDLPQFKGQFFFHITKQRPMPTYSVAGLDII